MGRAMCWRTNSSAYRSVRRHGNFFLSKTDTDPPRFALDNVRIALQRMYLFLESQIFVHQILYLGSQMCILFGLGFHLGKRMKIYRNTEHYKYRDHDQERQPPRSRPTACRGRLWPPRPRRGGSLRCQVIGVSVIPINICGLAQVSSPDPLCLRSRRIS